MRLKKRKLDRTKEFKEEFLKFYLNGDKSPTQIVTELGYDPNILGHHRITGIRCHILEKYKAGEPFEDGGYPQRIKGRTLAGKQQPMRTASDRDVVKQLRAEVNYLRQEVAFLKNLCRTGLGKDRRNSDGIDEYHIELGPGDYPKFCVNLYCGVE